jgi:hypothetical protein
LLAATVVTATLVFATRATTATIKENSEEATKNRYCNCGGHHKRIILYDTTVRFAWTGGARKASN